MFVRIVLVVLSLLGTLEAVAVPGVVTLKEGARHTGRFELRQQDLWTPASGIGVYTTRRYTAEGWQWNARWANVTFHEPKRFIGAGTAGRSSGGGGSVSAPEANETAWYEKYKYIQRDQAKFYHQGNGHFGGEDTFFEATAEDTTAGTHDGLTWQNNQGERAEYTTEGVLLRYWDAEGHEFTLQRDGLGRITGVRDLQLQRRPSAAGQRDRSHRPDRSIRVHQRSADSRHRRTGAALDLRL